MTSLATQRLYYQDTYLHEIDAKVIGIGNDAGEYYVVFDKTIFHPQGGGQPSDCGFFIAEGHRWEVTKLTIDGSCIKHYFTLPEGVQVPSFTDAHLVIDIESRALFARIHSAGHLMEDAITVLGLPIAAYKGFHDPQGPSVSFTVDNTKPPLDLQQAKTVIAKKVNELIAQNIPLRTFFDDTDTRIVQFEGLNSLGCGGTHVRHSGEIRSFSIRNVKKEKGGTEVKIGYDVVRQ